MSAEDSAGGQWDHDFIAHVIRLRIDDHPGEERVGPEDRAADGESSKTAIKGYKGEGLIMDSDYYLPLLDADGNIQVVRAHGVDEIVT